jgi:hypothetical protein
MTNCTLPVGVELLEAEALLTVAVKVTLWPYTEELSDELTVVVVGTTWTVVWKLTLLSFGVESPVMGPTAAVLLMTVPTVALLLT